MGKEGSEGGSLQAVCTSACLTPLLEHTRAGAGAPSPKSPGDLRKAQWNLPRLSSVAPWLGCPVALLSNIHRMVFEAPEGCLYGLTEEHVMPRCTETKNHFLKPFYLAVTSKV